LAAGYLGYRRRLRLDHLNQNRVINTLLAAMVVLTLMSLAHGLGLFSQAVAAKVTMSAYTLAGGFFIGYGVQLIVLRRRAGNLEYMYRSFWTDVAPNFISIALFAFGVYRAGVLHWDFLTGIGITSGLSLIGFGFLGWTVHVVPEFRSEGILMLDQFIEWKNVVAYEWAGEETLQIDYITSSGKISEFKTYIPPEDQLIIERLLGKKLKEYEEDRKQTMFEEDEK
jgi:hypothetical protein